MAAKLTLVTLALLTSLAIFITAAYLIPSTERPAALLGAGVGLAFVSILAAVLFRRRALIVPVLLFVLMTLTACGSDPLGLVAREQVRTQGAIEIAQIDAATTRATAAARIGGMVAIVGIMAMAAIAISMVGGATHIIAQRDRLSHDAWRASLPAQPHATALPAARPQQPGHWLALRRPDSQQRPTVLALPERSASASHDVIVIDG